MAARRGVGPADRAQLAGVVAAVLRREAGAVEAAGEALCRARDRASDSQAFEVAARIQEELRALAWVTCPQRAATLGGPDAVLAGWAGGVLVSFRVVAGRLGGWSQRRCPESRAAAPLAATPGEWAGFAQRNAELAALLTAAG